MSDFGLIINGQKAETESYFPVRNPANGEVIGEAPQASPAQLDEAVMAAEKAFASWSVVPNSERRQAVKAIAGVIKENHDELARLLTLEQGKPLKGMGSSFEVNGAMAWAKATAELDLPVKVIADSDVQLIEQHRKPVGVVGSITPWNFPILIAAWHILPAIRCGCTVVLRPSSLTPLATLRFVELLQQVLPPGVINVISGEGLGSRMTSHPGIKKMVFTGSTPTGQTIMRAAADSLKRLTLELGGNDAAVVIQDVDVSAVAQKIFWGAMINGGQTCAAIKRLYVHDDIYEQMCEALVAVAGKVPMGDGLNETNRLGPVQNEAQFNLVRDLVDDARARGARILCGGAPLDGPGYFYPVTLVADVSNGFRIVDEEQFGPVLPIIKFSTVEEGIALANDSEYGLGGSIWTSDLKQGQQLASRLQCGSAWVNTHAQTMPNVPFGGVKMSGIGVEFAEEGLAEYTTIQIVHIDKA